MLIIGDIYKLILKYVQFKDYISLLLLDKSNNAYIKLDKHYLKFREFFKELEKRMRCLKKNVDITKDAILRHQYALAIEFDCKRLMSYFKSGNGHGRIELRIIKASVKTDNIELFELFSNKLINQNGIHHFGLRKFAYEWHAHKIISKYYKNKAYVQEIPSVFNYIIKNNISDIQKDTLLNMLNRFFANLLVFGIQHNCHTYDNIAKIIIKFDLEYDLLPKLTEIMKSLKQPYVRNHTSLMVKKLDKYITYHMPKRFKNNHSN